VEQQKERDKQQQKNHDEGHKLQKNTADWNWGFGVAQVGLNVVGLVIRGS
jgi:hypothetical protein